MFSDTVQAVVTSSALLLGIIYVLGGLIINLHLAKYGIVDYQILQIKYLVAGLVYIPNMFGMALLALMASLVIFVLNIQINQILAILSVLSSVLLLITWAKPPRNPDSFLTKWWFWVLAGTISLVAPMQIIFIHMVLPTGGLLVSIESLEALLLFLLALIGQVYHYSSFYYGHAHSEIWNMQDPIGLGVPARIEMAVEPESADVLAEMGVPISKSGKSDMVTFLDETDSHYIIELENEGKTRILKITKNMVKAILYQSSSK